MKVGSHNAREGVENNGVDCVEKSNIFAIQGTVFCGTESPGGGNKVCLASPCMMMTLCTDVMTSPG